MFGVFDYLWKDISDGEVMIELGAKSVEEILMAGCSQPLRVTDLRAKLHEVVTASDASETGGLRVWVEADLPRAQRDARLGRGGG